MAATALRVALLCAAVLLVEAKTKFFIHGNKTVYWLTYGPNQYYISNRDAFPNGLNFTAAEAFCVSHGATLASVHSPAEDLWLAEQALKQSTLNRARSFWLGAQKNTSGLSVPPFSWTWIDGSSFDILGQYPSCTPGTNCLWNHVRHPRSADKTVNEPDNAAGNENCICLESSIKASNPGTWNDDACAIKKQFICKKSTVTTTPATTTTHNPHPGQCSLVTWSITATWFNGASIYVSVVGASSTTPRTVSWSWQQPTTIDSIWNANLVTSDSSGATVTADSSVPFGMTVGFTQPIEDPFDFFVDGTECGNLPTSTTTTGTPLTGTTTTGTTTTFTGTQLSCSSVADYTISSSWSGAFDTIVNVGAGPGQSGTITFTFNQPVTAISNFWANGISPTYSLVGNLYFTVTDAGNQFGFQGATAGSAGTFVHDIAVNGVPCTP